jgi:hypothetical protein
MSGQEAICTYCGTHFHRKTPRENHKPYCSRECIARSTNDLKNNHQPSFKYFLKAVRRRKWQTDLTEEYLRDLWSSQKGLCIYSKVPLLMPDYHIKNNPLYTASLDRIDSSVGYIKGNVQFVSTTVNYMKNTLTHEQTMEFISILRSK